MSLFINSFKVPHMNCTHPFGNGEILCRYYDGFDFSPGRAYAPIRDFDFNKPVMNHGLGQLTEGFFTVFYPYEIALWVDWLGKPGGRNGRFVIRVSSNASDQYDEYEKQVFLALLISYSFNYICA